MKRTEFLASLGALLAAPFLPRGKDKSCVTVTQKKVEWMKQRDEEILKEYPWHGAKNVKIPLTRQTLEDLHWYYHKLYLDTSPWMRG